MAAFRRKSVAVLHPSDDSAPAQEAVEAVAGADVAADGGGCAAGGSGAVAGKVTSAAGYIKLTDSRRGRPKRPYKLPPHKRVTGPHGSGPPHYQCNYCSYTGDRCGVDRPTVSVTSFFPPPLPMPKWRSPLP